MGFTRKRWLAAILLLGIAPAFPVVTASFLAEFNGCTLSEAGPTTCLIFGHNAGEPLMEMADCGWFGLATIPIATILLVVWLSCRAVIWLKRQREIQAFRLPYRSQIGPDTADRRL